ncbi:MAG: hypothetical protein LUC33_00660 [Prevotellaceae bacterium]|nr:hypothetical protein [Prevotellaceae bacterium]
MRRWLPFVIALLASTRSRAQLWDNLFSDPLGTDSAETQVLSLKVDATAFFRDNEYDGSSLTNGYTLPGVRLCPALTYNPISQIHLELGGYAIFYDGASKYPNYAFHDVATWKGSQYSRGSHALPFFRAEARLKTLTLVLGDIYGAQNHRMIYPLFNPELSLSADPEMGFQLLLNRKRVHLDAWLDWQSYIYELDTHQEAFTVGVNSEIRWNPKRGRLRWTTPVQLLIQHRGGEQDTTSLGVQTVANASIGLRLDADPRGHALSHVRAEANALLSYQQSGSLWPFQTGYATHASAQLTLWQCVAIEAGYVGAPKQYANLFGSPFFGTLSIVDDALRLRGVRTAYLRADYTYAFTRQYKLGADFELLSAHSRRLDETKFSFGVYFRVCPSFRLKAFKR